LFRAAVKNNREFVTLKIDASIICYRDKLWKPMSNTANLKIPDEKEILLKSPLVAKITEIINSRQWSQKQAADALGLAQPKLSRILNGHLGYVSQPKLLEYLTRLGCDVQIVVSPAQHPPAQGQITVAFT
jgi:predicted XRE-type DNA-binding protein